MTVPPNRLFTCITGTKTYYCQTKELPALRKYERNTEPSNYNTVIETYKLLRGLKKEEQNTKTFFP